jgi:16S rRNA (uracil1498-N3)-methyltransferase
VPVPGARLRLRLVVESLPEPGGSVRIRGGEAAHARARRLGRGDAVILVDGSGREASGNISAVRDGSIDVRIDSIAPAAVSGAPILLAVAAVRAERLAWIAEKAAELEVERLVLVHSDRAQSFRARDAVVTRLTRIVRSAAKQGEHARWPAVEGPLSLAELLSAERRANRFLLEPGGEPLPDSIVGPTALIVGPEGGWTDAEIAAASDAGWRPVSLAAGKLRAETAAVAAVVLARTAMARGVSRKS